MVTLSEETSKHGENEVLNHWMERAKSLGVEAPQNSTVFLVLESYFSENGNVKRNNQRVKVADVCGVGPTCSVLEAVDRCVPAVLCALSSLQQKNTRIGQVSKPIPLLMRQIHP